LPAAVALHETVAVPEPVRLDGLIDPQTRPDGTASVKATTPLKRLIALTVMVEMPELPALRGAGWEADSLKSRNWKRTVVEWLRLPLVPVTVRV
jgi:hypothetical protein